jgi:sulfite reductase beta subunit-like hemoprotein
MAVHLLTVYPYARFNEKGEFVNVYFQAWQPYGDEAKAGGTVGDGGTITVHLAPVQVRIESPDLQELEAKAVELLRAHKLQLTAAHHLLMTKLQFAENNLLRLAAPEILSAGEGPAGKPIWDDSNRGDIPF